MPARTKAYEEAQVPFEVINIDASGGCPSFDPKTGLCKIHKDKPEKCKAFPQQPIDIAALPNCGYRFEPLICPKCGTDLNPLCLLGDKNHVEFVSCQKCKVAYDVRTLKPVANVIF